MSDVVHYRGAQAPHAIRTLWWPACGLATVVAGPRVTRSKAKVTCRRCRAKLLTEQKRRAKPLPRVNRKRLAKRRAVEFAQQSSLVRFMCCCACAPSLYRDPQTIALEIDNARKWQALDVRPFNDAHHVVTRGSGRGRDQHCVALCADHHRLGPDAVHRIGVKSFEARFGAASIAAAIHNALKEQRS